MARDGVVAEVGAEGRDDLGLLRLGRPERWVLTQVRRRGVVGFVVQMAMVSILASLAMVAAMMVVLYGADDPSFVPALIMSVMVPAVVAPMVLIFTVRLAEGLDRAAVLLWDAAHTDPLTEVANRRAFFELADRPGGLGDGPFDVAVVDLDGFKSINDRHGHAAGDDALRRVARWLEELVGPGGLVARMGGDEFAVVVPADAPGDRPAATELDLDGLRVAATLGWHRCERGGSLESALRAADRELYARKPGGDRFTPAG